MSSTEESESPEVQLATYKEQLAQIEDSLRHDPKNESLLHLKAEILDVIKLTQDLLNLSSSSSSSSSASLSNSTKSRSSSGSGSSSSSSRSNSNGTSNSSKSSSSSKGGSSSGSDNRSKSILLQQQYALSEGASGNGDSDNDQDTSSNVASSDISISSSSSSPFTVGTKCMAKFSNDGIWYEAIIESVPTNEQDKFFVTYTEYGNQEYVTLDNLKVIQGEGKKRKDKPADSEDGVIPKSLKILPTDSEEVRQAKRRRQHAIKSQSRNKKLEEERSGKKSAWQEFTQKSGGGKLSASLASKKGSIFRSPDTVEGKVGVTGSGKPLTPSPQFKSTEVAHVKHKLPPPT